MSEPVLAQLCEIGASFYSRGLAFGSTGNLSVRTGEKIWVTPTGRSLRNLRPEDLACIDASGAALNANRASKESPFHLAAYRNAGERAGAIVHLHSTYSVAMSCLAHSEFPAITPYFQMRVAPLAVLPYFRPGSAELADAVGEAAKEHNCMLLRNHGLICMGRTLDEAVDRTEELEETAKLLFLLRGHAVQLLTADQVEDIRQVFGRS
jgi:ribulose-5-phosphate 4-epimerase/fuculose-1-phosphate aldolase